MQWMTKACNRITSLICIWHILLAHMIFNILYYIYNVLLLPVHKDPVNTVDGRRFRQQDVCWYNGEGLSNTPHLYQVHVHIELMATFI